MGEEIRDQAFEDYKKGMKYREIAEKYGVSLSAVKSWAARYWKKEGCNQAEKKLQPKKKKVAAEGNVSEGQGEPLEIIEVLPEDNGAENVSGGAEAPAGTENSQENQPEDKE